jgi:hypothetical protein
MQPNYYHQQEDLAKFGYRTRDKVKFLKNIFSILANCWNPLLKSGDILLIFLKTGELGPSFSHFLD